MMNETLINILLLVSIAAILSSGFFLIKTLREVSRINRTQSASIERLAQAAIAYRASSEITPSAGPAILQQVNKIPGLSPPTPKVDKKAERIKEDLQRQEDKEQRGGVSVKRGPV